MSCPAILKSGKRKGSKCQNPAKFGPYCGIHKNLVPSPTVRKKRAPERYALFKNYEGKWGVNDTQLLGSGTLKELAQEVADGVPRANYAKVLENFKKDGSFCLDSEITYYIIPIGLRARPAGHKQNLVEGSYYFYDAAPGGSSPVRFETEEEARKAFNEAKEVPAKDYASAGVFILFHVKDGNAIEDESETQEVGELGEELNEELAEESEEESEDSSQPSSPQVSLSWLHSTFFPENGKSEPEKEPE